MTQSSMQTRLASACDKIRAGGILDSDERRLVTTALREFIDRPSRARDGFLNRAAREESHRLLRRIYSEHFARLSYREAGRKIEGAIRRYAASAWREDQHVIACPNRLEDKPEALYWVLLRTSEAIPDAESIRKIIAG